MFLNHIGHYSFDLQIFEIPFYVAIDKAKQSVVVAIRGTLSLKVMYYYFVSYKHVVFSSHTIIKNRVSF